MAARVRPAKILAKILAKIVSLPDGGGAVKTRGGAPPLPDATSR